MSVIHKARARVFPLLLLLAGGCDPDDTVPMPEQGWERIGGSAERLEVPGGWLVRISTGYGAGITFVPDEEKRWKRR